MIKFHCKNCGREISVQDKHSGKRGKCPKCGNVVVVPDKSTIVEFHCENCGQKISVPKIHAGKKGKCPKCKSIVVVPKTESASQVASQAQPSSPEITPKVFSPDPRLFDLPQERKVANQHSSQQSVPDTTLEDTQRLREAMAIGNIEPEPLIERKLPWIIDIFLYPLNVPGLTVLGIIIVIPLLIYVLARLLGPFGFFISIPGFFVNIVIGLYMYWYFTECIRDSANGGLRAPETIGTTPGLGEMFSQMLNIAGCFIVFIGPPGFYFLYTHKTDTIFWALASYAVFFFPMGLLAVIVFDSFSALNPILLIGSIFSTFFQYCGLVFLFFIAGLLARMVPETQSAVLGFVFSCLSIYIMFVAAHLLGRFYWKYQEKLNWEV
jgi:DNA-directed RNA polymerase subunit RPC12/RpoP